MSSVLSDRLATRTLRPEHLMHTLEDLTLRPRPHTKGWICWPASAIPALYTVRQHWRQENQPEAASPASPGCGRNKKEAMPTKQMGRNDFRKLSSDLHKCPVAPVHPLTQLKTKEHFHWHLPHPSTPPLFLYVQVLRDTG